VKLIINYYIIQMALMTLRGSLGQRSTSYSGGYRNLLTKTYTHTSQKSRHEMIRFSRSWFQRSRSLKRFRRRHTDPRFAIDFCLVYVLIVVDTSTPESAVAYPCRSFTPQNYRHMRQTVRLSDRVY